MNWPTILGVLYVAAELVVRVVMLLVVPRNRSIGAAMAWLMLIMFLPWFGLIAYVLIGSPKLPQRRRDLQYRLDRTLARIIARAEADPDFAPIFDRDRDPRHHAIAALVERLGGLPAMNGNYVDLLPEYDVAVDQIIADIEQARRDVHVLFYIFADDTTGMRVAETLCRAARRGVIVRVLIDAQGSRKSITRLFSRLHAGGVVVHRALPFSLREYTRLDLRNHRKILVIDGAIGYTGSQNIVDADFKSGITYKELMVRSRGPLVAQLQAVFLADWYSETQERLIDPATVAVLEPPELPGSVAAQVLPSGPAYDIDHVPLLFSALLYAAQHRAVLVSPYFIPDEALLRAIEGAAYRGVDVHLVVSMIADQFVVSRAQRSYYDELLTAGVKVHLHNPPYLLHAKHLSIDNDMAVIGSSNADIRSFRLNLEASTLFYDSAVVSSLHLIESHYMAHATQLDHTQWCKRPLFQQLVENLLRLVSPLL